MEFDNNGNLHKRYRGAAVTPTETYYYDFQNRLVRIENSDQTKIEYEYDALGRLIRRYEKTSGDTITEGRAYIYDGWRLLEERDTLASSETSLRALYFYGSEGLNDLVLMRTWDGITAPSSSNYVDHWFHQDDMGNIIALSDEDGDIEEYYIYDDFGVPTAFNAAGVEQSTPISPFLFTGQMWDADAKLYYCRMRWYDPYLGRFTSRDPLGLWGDPLNLGNDQAYVGHSPWSWVDPYGLQGCREELMDFSTAIQKFGPGTLRNIRSANVADPTGGKLLEFLHSDASLQEEMLRTAEQTEGFNSAVVATNLTGVIAHEIVLAALEEAATAGLAPGAETLAARAADKLNDAKKLDRITDVTSNLSRFGDDVAEVCPPRQSGVGIADDSIDAVRWNNGWRTPDGKFASPNGTGRGGLAAEQSVWEAIKKKPDWTVIEGQVAVRNAAGQLRYYDGVAISPRGRVIGLEVKSGSAVKTPSQRAFDLGVTANNPAVGVGKSKGLIITRTIEIRR